MEPDERYYNMRQVINILDSYPEEVRRLCAILGIIPQDYTTLYKGNPSFLRHRPGPWDKRAKYISQRELDQLREMRGVVPEPADQSAVIAQLKRRVAELEAIVSRYQAPQQTHFAEMPAPRRVTSHTDRPHLPDGWLPLRQFCREQNIAFSTLEKAMDRGHVPPSHEGEWQEGNTIIKRAVDEAMQAAILEWDRDVHQRQQR